jgi:hypothetical protein
MPLTRTPSLPPGSVVISIQNGLGTRTGFRPRRARTWRTCSRSSPREQKLANAYGISIAAPVPTEVVKDEEGDEPQADAGRNGDRRLEPRANRLAVGPTEVTWVQSSSAR